MLPARSLPCALAALLALLSPLARPPAAAQGYRCRVLAAARAQAAPTIDGTLDDPAWKDALQAGPFIDPYTGQPAAEQTEACLLYDDRAIYVAFRCHDSRPDGIVAREIQHGAGFGGDDHVLFEIDPFNTRSSNTSIFLVNAIGTQSEVIAGGRAGKQEWRGIWQAAAHRTPDGWTAEMRIPWEVLRYPQGRSATFAVNFHRYHLRTHVTSSWSDLTSNGRPEYIGAWQGVTPPLRVAHPAWQGLAYTAPTFGSGSPSARGGLDVRYTPTPRISSLVSVTPDFRSVEQQVATIAFSRQEIYQSDSRPFFMEGGDQFSGPLFYSRRIGDFDVGAKAFGNATDRLTFGALTTLRGQSDVASVASARYDLTKGSYVSVAGSQAAGGGAAHDGLEGKCYLRSGTWRLLTDAVQARQGPTTGGSVLTALAYTAPHWWVDAHWEQVDRGYSPYLGLVDFVDRRGPLVSASYNNEYRHGPVRALFVNTSDYRFNHYDGRRFMDGQTLSCSVETRADNAVGLYAENSSFEGSRDLYAALSYTQHLSDRYRIWGVTYQFGRRADHGYGYLTGGLSRRFGGVDVGLSWSVLRHIQNREQYVLTVGREFNARQAFHVRVVAQDGKLNAYAAYRNAGGPGHDLYVILGDPNALETTWTVMLKSVWAM